MSSRKGFAGALALMLAAGLAVAACSSSAATPGPAANPAFGGYDTGSLSQAKPESGPTAAPVAAAASSAPLAPGQTLIIKTGQLDLQVSNPDGSAAQADSIVAGAGGYVAGSSRSGDADTLVISETYRIPVARWDATLTALHHASGGGTLRIVGEQIQTQDVTAAAVDLDARLVNLRASEQALLAIMDKAVSVTDVLAVQAQLTEVRGQIEELAAQRNQIGDQAAYSALTVQFMAAPKTDTAAAAGGWDLGKTVDDAGAALVRIGQGIATAAVWAVVVGLPSLAGLLVLLLAARLARGAWGRLRGRKPSAPPARA